MRIIKHYWHKALERIKRQPALPQVRELKRRLSAIRGENQALRLELTGVQQALDANRDREEQALAGLQQQIDHIQAERDAARQQVETLQGSLTDALRSQERTEQRVTTLNNTLQKERRNYQTEQQAARIRVRKLAQRTSAALLVAGLALLLATATTVIGIRDMRNNNRLLAEVSRDLKDIKFSMGKHQGGDLHATPGSPASLTDTAANTDPQDTLTGEDEGAAVGQQQGGYDRQPEPPTPEFEFDQAQYLDRLQHNKRRTKKEMLAFFEENATREGVISMPSGLQYKVLRNGSGRSPKATDSVVIDYRAFLSDGTEIYNTYDEAEPVTLNLKSFKQGLQQALPKMEEGSQWELYIPPELAYHRGVRRRTKYGFEPLIYVVELISVIEADSAAEQGREP